VYHSKGEETLSTLKPNLRPNLASLREKIGLIPTLGAALLLVGLSITTVGAAPPEQSPTGKLSTQRGEALWSENCAPCHGVTGRGDGPTAQMAQMADFPPTDFTDRAAARGRTLVEMFNITKEGRMERLMPPWGGSLSDDEIWDVVAYAQALGTTPGDIEAGEALYEEHCVECHATDGSGAVAGTSDFSDAATMATQSPQALFDVVSQGRDEMPAFADQMAEEERWQVVDYLRTLSYEPIVSEGVITGQVGNATTGEPVGDAEVRLRRWGTEAELPPLVAQADADGNFHFEGLDTGNHAFYLAEVTYDDVPFSSDFVSFEPGVSQLSVSVNVYETAPSDEDIQVERFHFIILGEQPGFLSVLELYQFSNLGDRAYVGTVNEEGFRETVRMALPAGAQDLTLQGGALGVDFLETDEGLVATSPIIPGEETFEVAFVYVAPYSGRTLELDRPLYYDTASVNGLVMDVGVKLKSDALSYEGERAAQGQTFLQYTGQDLATGETLPIQLVDLDKIEFASPSEPTDGTSETGMPVIPSSGLSQTTLLWLTLGLGALAIVFVLAYPSLRPRLAGEAPASQSDLTQERQRLLLTLARLDQAYEAGDLNEAVYRRARARRKAELADVLRRLQDYDL
jgi:mono/diheme cytochrome c family protein